MINGENILITGGSGTIGSALVSHILKNYDPNVIRIFSRDEGKQFFLKNKLKGEADKLRFLIGDVRDKERLQRAMKNIDTVFHLAAMKHVEVCEYNPFEAIKTNVMGLQNLVEVCIDEQVKKVIYTSTDKAASPSNTMGVTKLLGEKLITTANYYKGNIKSRFFSLRFGNVLGTRGSLIPLIEQQVKRNVPITLTHSEMTRYLMTIESAVEFILDTMEAGQGGEIFVKKMDSVRILELIEVLVDFFAQKYGKDKEKIKIKEIGMFAGEKLYEELFSLEESVRTYELDSKYVIFPQLTEVSNKIDLNKYPNIKEFDNNQPFNSRDGPFLSKDAIKQFLFENNILK